MPISAPGGPDADVVEALVGLGWQEKAAHAAVGEAREAMQGVGEAPQPAALLREALRRLGGRR